MEFILSNFIHFPLLT
ncbi:hypothetical protein F383_21301 [Gossypium arboreum]|uniref:Uncharacterized protein n=1 Tax=Gossypium arboreum TaxID=29729 RepID=A0A0B0NMY5_GOSAR|nr:hypothetical protein F383_21301 [Gossypium arboreum]